MSEDFKKQMERLKECQSLLAEAYIISTHTNNELNRIHAEIRTKWTLITDWIDHNSIEENKKRT